MINPPNWNQLATTPLAADDEAEARYVIAADNFLAALWRATKALEHCGYDELADHLRGSFLRAFQT